MSTVVHTSSYLQTRDFFPFRYVPIMGASFLFSPDRVSYPPNILMAEPAELVAPVVVVVNVVVVVVVVVEGGAVIGTLIIGLLSGLL